MTIAVHAPAVVDGVPLVLLHAFPLDSRMWDDVVALLPGVPVVRIDAPGFGDSPSAAPGLEPVAVEIVTAVRALGVERAVIAGLSMGGYLAMAVAERAPEVLAGIGLLSTKASADPEPAREKRWAMADAVERGEQEVALGMIDGLLGESTRSGAPDVVARVRDLLRSAPPAGLVWGQRSMAQRPDRLDVLRSLPDALPALVLRGDEDTLMSAADAAAMATALGTEVTVVDAAGHLVAIEHPRAVAAALAALHTRATTA